MIQNRQHVTTPFTGAQGTHAHRRADQRPGFMAVDTFQLGKLHLFAFGFQIQRLTATHARHAAGLRQLGNHCQPIAIAHLRHWRIGKDRERQRLQGISCQNGARLTVFNVAGRLAPAQIVIVHGRQIVMDQGVGVNALHGSSGGIQGVDADAKHAACGIDQKWPQALAA